jgi:hypothetical protein
VVFAACSRQGVLLLDVPLLPALVGALQDVEPLSPALTVYSLAPRADAFPLLAGAVRPAGLDVAAVLV